MLTFWPISNFCAVKFRILLFTYLIFRSQALCYVLKIERDLNELAPLNVFDYTWTVGV